jgi:hypothetical protein
MQTAEVMPLHEPAVGAGDKREVERLIRRVADMVHRLNEQVEATVRAGVTVELIRSSRVHDGTGHWGDQMVPLIRMPDHDDRD